MTKPWLAAAAVLLLVSVWALYYSVSRLPPKGMRAAVYRGAEFVGEPVLVLHDPQLDPVTAARQAGLDPREPFSIEWHGTAVVTENGKYHLRVFADDGVVLWVDDAIVVQQTSPGRHDLSGSIVLSEGLHAVRIRYVQFTGDAEFRLTSAAPSSREDFSELFLSPPQREPLIYRRVAKALRYPTMVAVSWSIWILCGLVLAFRAALRRCTGDDVFAVLRVPTMAGLAILSIALLGFAVHIGAAPWRGWAPDELIPLHLFDAAERRFANRWSHLYPPLHFYLLNTVIAPFLLLDRWGGLRLETSSTQALIHVVMRVTSVVMALATLLLTALIAEATIGRRRMVAAAACLLSVPIFVLYAKTANVDLPYLFWFAAAILCLVRAIQSRSVRAHALLGVAVACTVATKDQAYGFWAGAALVLVWCVWRESPVEWSLRKRARALAADRRLWVGFGACAGVYPLLAGVPWNFAGFRDHVELIVGGSQRFRMFPPTAEGMLGLAATTIRVTAATLGPVVLALAIGGFAVALSNRTRYRVLLLLFIPVLSYLVTFIAVVGYLYDRFLLGPALVAGLFAALGLDAVLGAIQNPHRRLAAAIALLAVALLPSAALNWRILDDPRLEAERWMATLEDDPLVLAVGPRQYLPNLYPFRHHVTLATSPEELLEWQADVIVIHEPDLRRRGDDAVTVWERVFETAGYAKVFTTDRRTPESWLIRVADLGRALDPMYSNLEKLEAPLSIWRRRESGQRGSDTVFNRKK
jgi:hypothetical protein